MAMVADKPQYGPAMAALNERQREFVIAYVLTGVGTDAVRKAGYGKPTTAGPTYARMAWNLLHRDDVRLAVAEESRRWLRAGAPTAVRTCLEIIENPMAKNADRLRACDLILQRVDPVVAGLVVEHKHEHAHRITLTADEIVARIAALASKTGIEPAMLPSPITIDAEAAE